MKVITLFNAKGGVGKTTLTAVIGAGLALRGYKVLLIDADGQGSLTTSVGLPVQAGFFKFVKWANKNKPDFVEARNLILHVPESACPENLFIVPGNEDTWGIPGSMHLTDIMRNLTQRLNIVERFFDYVLIDTQPSATTLHDAVGLASDWVICPTDCESLSFVALVKTIAFMSDIRSQALARGYDKCKIMGIIPNKYRSNTTLHDHVYKTLVHGQRLETGDLELDDEGNAVFEGYASLVWEPLPLRTTIPEMQMYRTVLMHDAPHLQTNMHLWRIVDRVIDATKVGSRV